MNILILEDEIYLAQKISNALENIGYKTYTHTDFYDVNKNIRYDTVLLSANLQSEDINQIIKKLKESVIILLVSYVNDITVTKPLDNGASDYILKPFLIKDLIRKIKHHQEYNKLKKEHKFFSEFLEFSFNDIDTQNIKLIFPILLESSSKSWINKTIFDIARKFDYKIKYFNADKLLYNNKDIKFKKGILYIFNNADIIKDWTGVIEQFNMLEFSIIFCTLTPTQNFPFQKIVYKKNLLDKGTILTIQEYVKMVILTHQDNLTDIEISKRLGISRKALWDKRKKMGIEKKKQKGNL